MPSQSAKTWEEPLNRIFHHYAESEYNAVEGPAYTDGPVIINKEKFSPLIGKALRKVEDAVLTEVKMVGDDIECVTLLKMQFDVL